MIDKTNRELAEQLDAVNAFDFFCWWQFDHERRKCTLEQALGAYCSAFPGRVLPLLTELLRRTIEQAPLLQAIIERS